MAEIIKFSWKLFCCSVVAEAIINLIIFLMMYSNKIAKRNNQVKGKNVMLNIFEFTGMSPLIINLIIILEYLAFIFVHPNSSSFLVSLMLNHVMFICACAIFNIANGITLRKMIKW